LILSKVVSADSAVQKALEVKSMAKASPNFWTEVIISFILLSFELCGFYRGRRAAVIFSDPEK
jgi:hypothetical protein